MIRFNWTVYEQNYVEEFEENTIERRNDERIETDRDFIDDESNIQSYAISDYLIDAYYVSERSNMIKQGDYYLEREEEYCRRLNRLCDDVNSLIWGTKGFIDYSKSLSGHLNEDYKIDSFANFEENVSGYLDSLYSCIRNGFRNDGMEEKREIFFRNIVEERQNYFRYSYIILREIPIIENSYQRYKERYLEYPYYDSYQRRELFEMIRLLPDRLGGIYMERKNLYLRHRHQTPWYVPAEGILLASMIINSNYFENYSYRVIGHVQRDAERYVDIVCKENYIYNDSDFFNQVIELERQVAVVNGFKAKYVKRSGCFGLMYIYASNGSVPEEYVAFSGQEDCQSLDIRRYFQLNEDTCRNLSTAMQMLVNAKFRSATWAKTTDEVKYYHVFEGNLATESIRQHMLRILLISENDLNDTKRKFACCERKILEEIGNGRAIITGIGSYSLFTRHETCNICKLALGNFENLYNIPHGLNRKYYAEEYNV